jgi:hypothetical protein
VALVSHPGYSTSKDHETALTNRVPFDLKMPNALTRKTLADADTGKDLTQHRSVDEMLKDMDVRWLNIRRLRLAFF